MFSKYMWQGKIFWNINLYYFLLVFSPFSSLPPEIPTWVYCLDERGKMEQKADIALKLLHLKAWAPAGRRFELWAKCLGQKQKDPGQSSGDEQGCRMGSPAAWLWRRPVSRDVALGYAHKLEALWALSDFNHVNFSHSVLKIWAMLHKNLGLSFSWIIGKLGHAGFCPSWHQMDKEWTP